MADVAGSPISVKVEETSQSVILTYFQGDIGSMVDAHFSRALSRADRAKPQLAKPKRNRKSLKSEDSNSCQWMATSSSSYPEAQFLSPKEEHGGLPFSPVDESPSGWPPFPVRQAGGLALPAMPYSLTADGLSLTGHQYANSLLNLLHSDRNDPGMGPGMGPSMGPVMGPGMGLGSKPELLPSWTAPGAFRDSLDPSFDHGRSVDKKDLYWY
ncbi:hypothetical protein CRUP_028111 [Coryphaenoides rupestris]|nr:hypothetical protein CRUP_028111 [Coryphaenoides rupestris]